MPASTQPSAQAHHTPDQLQSLLRLAGRIARLNPDSPTIGAGMLASLVDDARQVLDKQADASADVCTPKLSIDLSVFTEPPPAEPKGPDDAQYYGMYARQELAYYRAIKLLTGQVYRGVGPGMHKTLCHALTAAECLLRQSAYACIEHHVKACGTEYEALMAEYAAAKALES